MIQPSRESGFFLMLKESFGELKYDNYLLLFGVDGV